MFVRYLSAGLGARPVGLADLNGNFLPTWRRMATDRPPDPVQRPRPQGLKLGTLVLSQRDVMVVAVGLAATVWLYDLLFEEGWLKKSHKEHIEDQYQSSHERSKAD